MTDNQYISEWELLTNGTDPILQSADPDLYCASSQKQQPVGWHVIHTAISPWLHANLTLCYPLKHPAHGGESVATKLSFWCDSARDRTYNLSPPSRTRYLKTTELVDSKIKPKQLQYELQNMLTFTLIP